MVFDNLPSEYPGDAEWRERAATVIPGGASTGSKRVEALYGEEQLDLPAHYVSASGCMLTTPGGTELIDCTMALGAVALGYAAESVTRRVIAEVAGGNVAGLSHVLEVEVADRLVDVIPCAEQVRFLKTGAEAASAAVRVARTYTGRTHVVASGYFGWHDWAGDTAGIPENSRRDVTCVPFDDVAALEGAVRRATGGVAAIVLEPVVERYPSKEWLARARALASDTGAVLAFDEIKTGFRLRQGGYQEECGIEPDLAVFGKALANGFPLAALVGRADVMDAARRTWISSTLAGESVALAAASAVLDAHESGDVCAQLAEIGSAMQTAVRHAAEASGIAGVTVAGIPAMWFLRFEDAGAESRFLQLAVERNVLFKRGAYNYASLAHTDEILLTIERAASSAFVEMVEESE